MTNVLERVAQVVGSPEDAKRWLEEPAPGLGYKRPVDLLQTKSGSAEVLRLLEQIDQGVYV